jgi:hypothetical protein
MRFPLKLPHVSKGGFYEDNKSGGMQTNASAPLTGNAGRGCRYSGEYMVAREPSSTRRRYIIVTNDYKYFRLSNTYAPRASLIACPSSMTDMA